MLKNLEKYKIILSSQSPRRQELLKNIGISYDVVVKKDVDESYPSTLNTIEVAEYLANKKLTAYQDLINEKSLIITADTIVIKDNEILGKPSSYDDAFSMIKKLSGSEHIVATGVALASQTKKISFTATTSVHFSILSDQEIHHYISTCNPFDKAGSYGIQEWIGYIGIEKIEGSFYNVMGLPLQKLYKELKKF